MENVYFYDEKASKDITKLLEDDYFKRLGYIVRECRLLGSQRKGCFLYIKGQSENLDRAEEMLKKIGIEKLAGEEKKVIVKAILEEEDAAAQGMGLIFG
ncbi:MAG TPA: hypothetical protein HA257_00910 [Candidatus Methanoperedenaceae archaeon]|nr:hypothetical protein [Candidatus Methanoperedenaceae archaeon]